MSLSCHLGNDCDWKISSLNPEQVGKNLPAVAGLRWSSHREQLTSVTSTVCAENQPIRRPGSKQQQQQQPGRGPELGQNWARTGGSGRPGSKLFVALGSESKRSTCPTCGPLRDQRHFWTRASHHGPGTTHFTASHLPHVLRAHRSIMGNVSSSIHMLTCLLVEREGGACPGL